MGAQIYHQLGYWSFTVVGVEALSVRIRQVWVKNVMDFVHSNILTRP